MITVAGFNTAIDRRVDLDVLQPGTVQRARSVRVRPGGKGLHVAQTVAAFGEAVRLVGLSDAVHEDFLRTHLDARGVQWHAVCATGELRQCLAIHEAGGRVSEILERGPELDDAACGALLTTLAEAVDGAHTLVISGSLPRGCAADTYANLIREATARGVHCLLDASGDALRQGIAACPWLVKPNADEAAALWGAPVKDVGTAAAFARWLHARGVARVIVTLGALGAVGFDGQSAWHARSARVEVRDSVGSGDCFLAGLAISAVRGDPLETSLRLAVSCGAANAESGEGGFAAPDRVAAWMPRVELRPLALPARVDGGA